MRSSERQHEESKTLKGSPRTRRRAKVIRDLSTDPYFSESVLVVRAQLNKPGQLYC